MVLDGELRLQGANRAFRLIAIRGGARTSIGNVRVTPLLVEGIRRISR